MVNPYDYYITPEEYERAAEHGVDAVNLARRIRELGWSKERAITTPLRQFNDGITYWRQVAEKNGISFAAFHSRINRGWDPEIAATKPLQTAHEARVQALAATEKVRKIPSWCIELAKKNGIQHATLWSRIKKGWSLEEAATRPLMTRQQSGRLGASSLRAREGDWAAQIFSKRKEGLHA